MNILIQLWDVQSPQHAGELRCKAERHAVEDDAAKLLRLSLALDRLLETVAEVEKDMQDEGTTTLGDTSITLIMIM
jgi:hypothetical protein